MKGTKKKKVTSMSDRAEKGIQTGADEEEEEHHLEEEQDAVPDTGGGAEEFRRDAKIWSLYLKEAGEQANAQAEIWKTGLESLLLFAGLFAGVVASFLIESRRKLRTDDQEFLLQDIRNALRNLPPPVDDYQPAKSQLWINALWFASLLITLFSAIVGVLARSWLVKYVPVTTREESDDAYQRWMLDQRTRRWKMERVITVIPLLVQLAFFLFAAGLEIQVFDDHHTIGAIVLGAVGIGTMVYLLVTALPLFLPAESCPFQTPLSDILIEVQKLVVWLKDRKERKAEPSPEFLQANDLDRHDRTDILAMIWYNNLIKSPKPDHVDEAIAELTRKPLTPERLKSFAESEAPRISLKRLESCMNSEYQDLPRRNDIMSNHLLALPRFITYSESINHEHAGLKATLLESLNPERPLSRWNFFTEPVRPLAFSIRVPILLAFNQDIGKTEVDEHPWEKLASNLQAKHRVSFMLAACRALVEGGENLKRVSSFSIAFCMASAVKSGYKSEWSGVIGPYKKKVNDLAQDYVIRLFDEIASGWKQGPSEYLKIHSSTGTPEPEQDIDSSGLPGSLAAALTHTKAKYRHQAALTIVSLAEEGDMYSHAIHMSIPTLIVMAVSDENADVTKAATKAIHALGTCGDYNDALKEKLPELIEQEMISYYGPNRQKALDLLLSLADDVSVFEDVLKLTIVGLVTSAFTDPDTGIQEGSIQLLERLVQLSDIQGVLEDAIRSRILADIQDGNWATRQAAFKMIPRLVSLCTSPESELFKAESFHRVMQPIALPVVTAAINDSDSDVRAAGQATVKQLLEREPPDELHNVILPQLKKELQTALFGEPWLRRFDAIEFIHARFDQPQFEEIVKDALPRISELALTDPYDDVRVSALTLFQDLVVMVRFKPAVVAALPVDLNQYTGLGWRSREQLIGLLKKLIINADNREGLKYIVKLTIHDDDVDVRDAGVNSLLDLCGTDSASAEHILEAVKSALPQRIDLIPSDDNLPESLAWAKTLFRLMQNGSIIDSCCTILQASLDQRPKDTAQDTTAAEHIEGEQLPVNLTSVERACSILAGLARAQDVHQSIRIASMVALHSMLHDQEIEAAWIEFKGLANDLLVDTNSEIVYNYVNLLATAVSKYDFIEVLPKLLTLLSGNPDATDLRYRCLEVMEALGHKETSAVAIIKAVRPQLSAISSSSWRLREAWAKMLGTLANNAEFVDGVCHLVVMGIKDEDTDVRRTSLESLAELAGQPEKKHADTILNATELSKNFDSISSNTSWRERQAWANVLSALSKHATDFSLGRLKLVDMVVEDDDSDVRFTAYEGLNKLAEDPKGRDMITSALSKSFETSLRDPHRERRSRAIDNLRWDYVKPDFKFGDVLKTLSGSVLKVALTDESDLVRDAAVDLLTMMIQHQGVQGINSAILSAIASSIASFTERGKVVGLRLVQSMPNDLSDDAVSTTTRNVTQLFKHNYGPTRTTALEILAILYKKGLASQFIQSNITDIVSLALEDNNEDIRVRALNLLIDLCDDLTFLSKIKTSQPRLMVLLENRYLRPSAVELISLLSQDASVRRSVASWIISSVTTDANMQLEGIMELLSNLIIERRFSDDAQGADYILLFFASSLVLKSSMAKFRARLTTSLWCNYRNLAKKAMENNQGLPPSLIDWFMTSIFGRHVTSYEVKAWMDMQKYIEPKEPEKVQE